MTARNCMTCVHRHADLCKHPQAAHIWGKLGGLQTILPDRGWPRWPQATEWCGFFNPTQEWRDKAESTAKKLKKAAA